MLKNVIVSLTISIIFQINKVDSHLFIGNRNFNPPRCPWPNTQTKSPRFATVGLLHMLQFNTRAASFGNFIIYQCIGIKTGQKFDIVRKNIASRLNK